MAFLQLKDPLELFMKRRKFVPFSGVGGSVRVHMCHRLVVKSWYFHIVKTDDLLQGPKRIG